MGKRGKGHDAEGEALWARVVGTAAPLKRRGATPRPADKPVAPPPKPKPEPLAAPPLPARPPAPPPKPAPVPHAAVLDRQTARQLEKGRLEVEARLDLHGLRQRDAHAQLRRFLKSAQGRGLKHVLVITGKGADPETRKSFYEEEERGVLRSAVPRWLTEPDFAPLVVSFSPAPRRLGGDGALYVRLRKLRPTK
jgi:DNA-nicking Smr family endonuclease